MKRMTAIIMLALLTAATLTGCDMVKAGAKCKAGSPAGRDANFVLFCTDGRWKRTLTIQQAADFIVGTLPGKVELVSTAPAAEAGGSFNPSVKLKVTNRNGQARSGAKVTLTGPATGAGLKDYAATTEETGSDGIATFAHIYDVTPVPGTFSVTAKVDGSDVSTTFDVTVRAGRAANIALVSGGTQTTTVGVPFAQPVVVKVTDYFGNPVSGARVFFRGFNVGDFTPGETVTDANGLAQATPRVPTSAGMLYGAADATTSPSSISASIALTVTT